MKKINEDGIVTDKDGAHLEDFDMPLNLMFCDFTIFEGDFETAVKGIRKIFNDELVAAGYEPFEVKDEE